MVKSPPFHDELYSALVDQAKEKLLIVAPRGHAKSTVVGLITPMHDILFGNGSRVICLVSRTQKHAIRLLNTVKEELNHNSTIKFMFGDWSEHTSKKWAETEIILKDNSMIIAIGMGQQIRGIKHGNQRPTLILVDDPEDKENTKTKDAMNSNFEWLLEEAIPAKDPKIGRIAVIGTVVADECLVDRLKKMKGWKVLWYQAVIDEEKKDVLWPDWWSYEKLMAEKESMASVGKLSSWYQEFQNVIIGDEEQVFRPEYFQYWNGEWEFNENERYTVLKTEKKDIPVNVFMGIDPASSTAQWADYSVVLVLGMTNSRDLYVIDYFRKRLPPMELADEIIAMVKRYKPLGVNIETVGYQEMMRDYLRNSGIYIPGIERKNNPRAKKSDRLMSLQPHFAQKKVWMKENMSALREELTTFPRGRHDDVLDGFYYALKNSYPCSVKDTKSKKKKSFSNKINWTTGLRVAK